MYTHTHTHAALNRVCDTADTQAVLAKRLLDDADAATKKLRQDDESLKKSLLAALVSKATAQAALATRTGADPSAQSSQRVSVLSAAHLSPPIKRQSCSAEQARSDLSTLPWQCSAAGSILLSTRRG
jgi:hypothetical protein